MPAFRAPVASFKVRVPEGAYDKVMAAMASAVAAMTDAGPSAPETIAQEARTLLEKILSQMREVHNYLPKPEEDDDEAVPKPLDWQVVDARWRRAYQDKYVALFKQTYSGVAMAYAEQHIGSEKWLVVLDAEH